MPFNDDDATLRRTLFPNRRIVDSARYVGSLFVIVRGMPAVGSDWITSGMQKTQVMTWTVSDVVDGFLLRQPHN
jgi:hypothetical protein